jgi:ubiquitin C-terminal hydrolase
MAQLRKENDYAGLHNQSSICYINSLIQTLLQNTELCSAIIAYKYPYSEDSQQSLQEQDKNDIQSAKIVVALQELLTSLVMDVNKVINPEAFI